MTIWLDFNSHQHAMNQRNTQEQKARFDKG